MLKIMFSTKDILPKQMPKDYPDILVYNGLFEIRIEGKTFFYEPDFPVFELLLFYDGWLKENGNKNFDYISAETEENPLLSFQHNSRDEWCLNSP